MTGKWNIVQFQMFSAKRMEIYSFNLMPKTLSIKDTSAKPEHINLVIVLKKLFTDL